MNQGVLHIQLNSKSGASPSDAVYYYNQNTHVGVNFNPLESCNHVFYSASQQAREKNWRETFGSFIL